MTRHVEFDENVGDLFLDILERKYGPEPGVIIETGPYKGQGSTKALIAAQNEFDPIPHLALEIVWEFVLEAREAVKDYPWVEVIHAVPTGLTEARQFILEDEWLKQCPRTIVDYPDPLGGYLWELSDEHIGANEHVPEQFWFARHLPRYRRKMPFFFLDSGGGTGWLEFLTVTALMHGYQYYVFLDDTDHVKHWRSREHIEQHPKEWQIEAKDNKKTPRWIFARKV